KGLRNMVVPADNGPEAAVVEGLNVYAFEELTQVMEWLRGGGNHQKLNVDVDEMFRTNGQQQVLDFRDVRGQENVKRAWEVAAAGSHNVVMVGAPGSGKTKMARRLPKRWPQVTHKQAQETTKIHSA